MARPSLLAAAAVCVLAGAGAAACGGGDSSPPASSSTRAPTTTTTQAPTTTRPECPPEGTTVERGGVHLREFCGPAAARLGVGEETLEFSGGACLRTTESFELHIGAEVIEGAVGAAGGDPDGTDGTASTGDGGDGDDGGAPGEAAAEEATAEPTSFSILLGRHPAAPEDALPADRDGTYNEGTVTFSVPGASYFLSDKTITLVATRSAGTLDGVALRGETGESPEVSGTFTCDAGAVPLDRVAELIAQSEG